MASTCRCIASVFLLPVALSLTLKGEPQLGFFPSTKQDASPLRKLFRNAEYAHTESVPDSPPMGPPHWASMVINMDQRPDRLQKFAVAIAKQEPWLLKESSMCRISGRDAPDLSHWSVQQQLGGSVHLRAQRSDHSRKQGAGNLQDYPPVPHSLQDSLSLVSDGWVSKAGMDAAVASRDGWPALTPGGIGLYLAHVDAWRNIIKMNLDYGVIFEDDLTLFAPGFEQHVSSVLATQSHGTGWDMLYLQWDSEAWPKQRASWGGAEPHIPESVVKASPVVVPIAPKAVVACTGAYILTREGAEKLLRTALPAGDQLDFQLGNVPGFRRSKYSVPMAQCWELYTDENGEVQRDTDVQLPEEFQGNTDPEVVQGKYIRDEETGALTTEKEYWRKTNEDLDEWNQKWRKNHPSAGHEQGHPFAGHGLHLLSTNSESIQIADCAQ